MCNSLDLSLNEAAESGVLSHTLVLLPRNSHSWTWADVMISTLMAALLTRNHRKSEWENFSTYSQAYQPPAINIKRQQVFLLAQLAKGHTSRVSICVFICGGMEKTLKKHLDDGRLQPPTNKTISVVCRSSGQGCKGNIHTLSPQSPVWIWHFTFPLNSKLSTTSATNKRVKMERKEADGNHILWQYTVVAHLWTHAI